MSAAERRVRVEHSDGVATIALDSPHNRNALSDQLVRELHAGGATILVVTHDAGLAAALPRRIRMLDGHVVSDAAGEAP